MHKYVGENAKYVEKGYPDVQNDVGKNVGRNTSREAFPTQYQIGVRKTFPDAGGCVGIDGVGKTLFPTPSMPTHLPASGKPVFRRFFPDLPLVKLMLGDFYLVLQSVPKLHEV
ncbi:hypothetical protein E6C27_scaffold223G00270 [Cucumis melo var. makuwa]|uniref:Uncharacterized protein n=1 Tax=Cucumis melo var. makuwa TaxID=1194695 RepID=A0A5A7SP10_CUCMM|nr:hypothetical protein E6C27_scaffold223G00270 [Cucumis melo var. makuwa]